MNKIGFWDAMFSDIGARASEGLNEAAHALSQSYGTVDSKAVFGFARVFFCCLYASTLKLH